jgi:hypothetical protein
MVPNPAMEFAATALGLMTPTEAPLWWEFFDDFPRTNMLARLRAARLVALPWSHLLTRYLRGRP